LVARSDSRARFSAVLADAAGAVGVQKYDLSENYKDLILSLFDDVNDVNFLIDLECLRCIVFLRTDIFYKFKRN
jgi:hypothetical protein